MKLIKYFVIASFMMLPLYSAAQSVELEDPVEITMEDFMAVKIPPLDVLLENARQNPSVKYQEEYAHQQELGLKSEKRTWLRYIKLTAGYQWGQMMSLTNSYNGDEIVDTNIPSYIYGNRAQHYYNVGASLSFPLEEIFDRGNKVKQQESVIKRARYEAERNFNDLALQIVDAYTAAIENLTVLKTKAEAAVLSSAQYKVTEQDFINGRVDAQTLSRQKNIESVNTREYELTRRTLINSLLRLEILSNTPIISK